MTNDSIAKILKAQEFISSNLLPLTNVMQAILDSNRIALAAQDANRFRELTRVAFGPIDEFGHLVRDMNFAFHLSEEFRQMQDIVLAAEKQFYLPEITNAMTFLQQFGDSDVADAINRYQLDTLEIQRSIQAMTTSWIDELNRTLSLEGLVALHGIGRGLGTMQPFEPRLADALRADLGDWRNRITWPPAIFDDAIVRTAFYEKRGLNPTLAAFPSDAFEQIVSNAGLKGSETPIADGYGFEPEREAADIEFAFERTNSAHDTLQRFETQLRSFIDQRMEHTYGKDWIKQRVPGEIWSKWVDKRQKAKDEGEQEWPLIAYADFSDYPTIITKKDNWENVFAAVFRRKTSVQESFQRLNPIRICTMHSRLITQDDELYLLVESKRLLKAIGINT